jgi:hypothetical protein
MARVVVAAFAAILSGALFVAALHLFDVKAFRWAAVAAAGGLATAPLAARQWSAVLIAFFDG